MSTISYASSDRSGFNTPSTTVASGASFGCSTPTAEQFAYKRSEQDIFLEKINAETEDLVDTISFIAKKAEFSGGWAQRRTDDHRIVTLIKSDTLFDRMLYAVLHTRMTGPPHFDNGTQRLPDLYYRLTKSSHPTESKPIVPLIPTVLPSTQSTIRAYASDVQEINKFYGAAQEFRAAFENAASHPDFPAMFNALDFVHGESPITSGEPIDEWEPLIRSSDFPTMPAIVRARAQAVTDSLVTFAREVQESACYTNPASRMSRAPIELREFVTLHTSEDLLPVHSLVSFACLHDLMVDNPAQKEICGAAEVLTGVSVDKGRVYPYVCPKSMLPTLPGADAQDSDYAERELLRTLGKNFNDIDDLRNKLKRVTTNSNLSAWLTALAMAYGDVRCRI